MKNNREQKKNSELPKIRIPSELFEKMTKVLEGLNKNEMGVEITMSTLRRMSYKSFMEELLANGMTLKYKLE